MAGKTFGYVRVSSKDQNEARQVEELKKLGIEDRDIFVDKESGKSFDRVQYQLLRGHQLRAGDVLYIKSIDRFGRNYDEILREWSYLVKELGVDIVVTDMPLLDTRTNKDLLGSLISDIVLQLLSFVAESERRSIKQRQAGGIAVAKKNGVRFGRKQRDFPDGWDEAIEQWRANKLTAAECCRALGLPRATFYRMAERCLKEEENDNGEML